MIVGGLSGSGVEREFRRGEEERGDWKHICGIISISLCFADHNAAHKCDLWPWFNGLSRDLVGIRWLFQYGDVRKGARWMHHHNRKWGLVSGQENMRRQISDHLMADRCYFTLTEKASVNKRQMRSDVDSSALSIKWFIPGARVISGSGQCTCKNPAGVSLVSEIININATTT